METTSTIDTSILRPVTSSNVEEIGYDSTSSTLLVRFRGGNLYSYKDVPEEVATKLINDPDEGSVGKHLSRHIKANYLSAKLN